MSVINVILNREIFKSARVATQIPSSEITKCSTAPQLSSAKR
jgi:hypothetical protein